MEHMDAKYRLLNNTGIPVLGFGTYKITDEAEAEASVREAIRLGYRHVDTAAFYNNEAAVGRAIRAAMAENGLSREDLFVTSKVWKTENTYDKVMASFDKTMADLGIGYLDLYLVHWPSSYVFDDNWKETNREVWSAMIDIYKSGRVRAIGVSNFLTHHLDTIIDMEVIPMVDQIEINPGFLQKETVEYCQKRGIVVEAWSPLGRGRIMNNEMLITLAEKYGVTVAQLALRWELQHDIVVLPKSVTPARIEENMKIFDFEIDEDDMQAMDEMEPAGASGHSPDQI